MEAKIGNKGMVLKGRPSEISDYLSGLAEKYGRKATLKIVLEKENAEQKNPPSRAHSG